MLAYTANQAKTNFDHFLDLVQREPVRVTRRDRTVGVMVAAQDYEAMRVFYANRLQSALAVNTAQAGLSGAQAEALLAD
jgi:PHD/YefM family antitoxin component YafN of YafNO toxin-antitoxin module